MSPTIQAPISEVRKHLADGIKVTFSGSDQQNKLLLQSLLYSYIRQRRAGAKHMKNRELAQRLYMALYFIEQKFKQIDKYSYWGHCDELVKAEPLILETLPAPEGKHRRIRLTMLGLIDRAKDVISTTASVYYQTHTK